MVVDKVLELNFVCFKGEHEYHEWTNKTNISNSSWHSLIRAIRVPLYRNPGYHAF